MNYRDDREALHHRVDQLEDELAERRGDLEARDAEIAARDATIRDLRAGKRPAPTPTRPRSALVAGIGIAVAAFVAAAVFTLRAKPTTRYIEPPRTTAPPREPPALPVTAPARPPPVVTKVQWPAKVVKAEGIRLAPGAACTVDEELADDKFSALAVRCGTEKVYDSHDELSGISMTSATPGADPQGRPTLAYKDLGTRSGGRGQIDLDTKLGVAGVFSETLPRFRVELSISPAPAR